MRISDWSSDVCSSDLEQRNLQIVRAVEDLTARHRRIVVFAASVGHAHLIRAVLSARGVAAHLVIGDMDMSARDAAIRRYNGNAAHPIVMRTDERRGWN